MLMLTTFIYKRLISGVSGALLLVMPQGGAIFPYTDGFVSVAEAPSIEAPFVEYPVLKEICSCESGLKHYEEDGTTVIRGKINSRDIGICQINEFYHEKRINELGLDIHTLEGNIAFAKDLYERQGTAPWIWSKPCWSKK